MFGSFIFLFTEMFDFFFFFFFFFFAPPYQSHFSFGDNEFLKGTNSCFFHFFIFCSTQSTIAFFTARFGNNNLVSSGWLVSGDVKCNLNHASIALRSYVRP
jgi:hypothetical protein